MSEDFYKPALPVPASLPFVFCPQTTDTWPRAKEAERPVGRAGREEGAGHGLLGPPGLAKGPGTATASSPRAPAADARGRCRPTCRPTERARPWSRGTHAARAPRPASWLPRSRQAAETLLTRGPRGGAASTFKGLQFREKIYNLFNKDCKAIGAL